MLKNPSLRNQQGDMGGLHRLLHDGQQVLAQPVQVHFLAQGGVEGCHSLAASYLPR